MPKYGARHLLPCMGILSEHDTARLLAVIEREGNIERVRMRMRIGESTMDSARQFGRIRNDARERIREGLDREEAGR
jgi:hypothetical protein